MTCVGSAALKETLPTAGVAPEIDETLYETIPEAKIPSSFAVVPEPEPPSPGPGIEEPATEPICNCGNLYVLALG